MNKALGKVELDVSSVKVITRGNMQKLSVVAYWDDVDL